MGGALEVSKLKSSERNFVSVPAAGQKLTQRGDLFGAILCPGLPSRGIFGTASDALSVLLKIGVVDGWVDAAVTLDSDRSVRIVPLEADNDAELACELENAWK